MKLKNPKQKKISKGKGLGLFILILSMTSIIAENPLSINLIEGKNNFTINEYFPSIYASQLIEEHHQIQSISISEYSSTFGYVNILGGVGTNILIESNREYEVYVSENITIELIN